MTPRQRTFVIFGVAMVSLVAIIYVASSSILLDGFATLEVQSAQRDVQRAQEALTNELANLSSQTADWANWDDTYAFVEDANPEYIEANLADKSLVDLRLNLIVVVNTAGQTVYSKGTDLATASDLPVPQDLLARLTPGDKLLEPAATGVTQAGLVLLHRAPLLIVAKPILTNEGQGPAHGTLIFGRYLDDAEVKLLAQITHLSLALRRLDLPLPPDFQAVQTTSWPATPIATHLLDPQTIAAYTALTDLDHQPIALLRVDAARTIYQQGLASLSFFHVMLLALSTGFGGVIWALLLHLMRRTQRESEALYRAIIEQTSEGILLADADTLCLLESNAAAQHLLGYTASELGRLTLAELVVAPAETAGQPPRPTEALPSGAIAEAEYRRKDGSTVAVEVSLNRIVYGGQQRLCAALRDITERVRSERERRQAEQLIQAQTQQLQAQNKESLRQTEELLVKSRTLAQAEAELRHLNADLEQRVAARTAELSARTIELRRVNAELAQAMHAKDEFIANMSHELRSPLTSILGLSESLQMETYGPLAGAQIKSLQAIHTSGEHLLALITDILDLAKIGASKLELRPDAVEVVDLCEASLRLVSPQATKKGLTVTSRYDPAVETLPADGRRLKQMLVNLLSNAVKFTPAGGSVGLEVTGDAAQGLAHFVVWDTGLGISAENQQRLFQPFMQVESSLSRHHEGAGLGLVLVRQLAELHGGQIGVTSTGVPGEGSRFTLSLPWPPAAPRRRAPPAAAPIAAPPAALRGVPIDGRAPLVLLAEDNDILAQALAEMLRAQAYAVLIAADGAAALELAREHLPALILMDIQLPKVSGLEAIGQIRADPALAATPIIVLTALVMEGDRERCLAAGANDYLSKPVNFPQLLKRLRQHLAPAQDLDQRPEARTRGEQPVAVSASI